MRRYLLDTTPLSAYLNGQPAAVERFDPWITRHEVATSVLAYARWLKDYAAGRASMNASCNCVSF